MPPRIFSEINVLLNKPVSRPLYIFFFPFFPLSGLSYGVVVLPGAAVLVESIGHSSDLLKEALHVAGGVVGPALEVGVQDEAVVVVRQGGGVATHGTVAFLVQTAEPSAIGEAMPRHKYYGTGERKLGKLKNIKKEKTFYSKD